MLNNGDFADPHLADVLLEQLQQDLEQERQQDQLELQDEDVLLGRGHGPRTHPGSLAKRALIIDNYSRYEENTIPRKELCEEVYDTLTAQGRRFIIKKKLDGGSSRFEEVSKEVAIERIAGNFNQYQQELRKLMAENRLPAIEETVSNNELPAAPVVPPSPNAIVPNEDPLLLQPNTVHSNEPLSVHVERMEKERSKALNENERLRNEIAELRAAERNDPSVDDLRTRLAASEDARNALEKQLKESKAQASKALDEVKELRKNLDGKVDSVSLFQDLVLGVSEPARHDDDLTILSGFLESMSVSEEVPTDGTVKSGNSNDQQRRKLAKTANDSGSAPAVRELPRKYDARTILSGLSDWRRSFIDLPQNMQEMKIVEKLQVGKGIYRGSILRGKPHGLGLLRMKGRIILANWNNGVATGLACVWYANGDAYFGRLEANEREGNGIYHSTKDCFEYVGPFKKDLRHGEDGHFKFTKGHEMSAHEFKGTFARGVFEGKGTHRHPNGDLESGRFANWILVEADAIAPEAAATADG